MQIEWLQTKYKAQAKCLQQTGGGIGMETFRGEDGNEYMAFYIPSTGPDCTTTPEAVNIWAQIEQEFPFFPRLHQIFATRPNVTPIAITTGVGPRGPSTLYVQPPDESFTPAQVAQINTLQDALNLAAAYPNRFDNDNEPIWSGSTNLQDGRDRDGPAADDPVDLDDDFVLVNPPQVPVTPAPHRSNAGKKENIVPTPQTQTRGPKALKHEASIERARAAIKKLPVKQTPLDRLLVLQENNLNAINARATAESERAKTELALKERQQLLEELKLGIWTPAEYRKKVKKIDKRLEAPPPPPSRSYSPDWDDELLSDDPKSSSVPSSPS
ncbi:hypothetical protein C8R44DRAFT_881892 [Mycena epipterygia]|nr:hypothetical protein C8R44DRAFT_881892 [Mycena epipterygia]